MKKSVISLVALGLVLGSGTALANGKKDGESDVEISHMPVSENFILFVTPSALKGHLKHGDCIVTPPPRGSDLEDAVEDAVFDAGLELSEAYDC